MYKWACRIDSHRDLIHRYILLYLKLSDPRKFYFSNAALLSVILTIYGNGCPKSMAKIFRSKCWSSAGYLHPEYLVSSSIEIGDLHRLGKFCFISIQWQLNYKKTSVCRWRSQQSLSWSPCNANVCQCSSLFAAWSQKQETQHLSYPLNLNGKILSSLFFLWFLYWVFWFTLVVFFSFLIKKEFKWTFVVAKSLLS